jgi:Tfp pilus assembly protein PilX
MIKISDMKTLRGVRTGQGSLSQRGMASIVITMVTMVVISLIVLGFATISRRESRQSLDQLQSTQAFYAAESGIEDARKAIRNWLAAPATAALPVPSKPNCTDASNPSIYPIGDDMKIDDANGIGYTCLQVDPAPDSVEFDGIDSDSTVIPLTSTTGGIRRIEITWQANTPPSLANCPSTITNPEFRPQSGVNAWRCEYGVMRVDLTPTNGVLTRAGLSGSTYSGFFQPVNFLAGGSDNYTNVNQARLVAARCTVTNCRATIDLIPNLTSISLRLSSLYQPSDVRIVAFNNNGVGGTPLSLSGVQAEVDVTGKASDVLRRIKVRIPLLNNGTLVPGHAITSNGSICKRFSTAPSYFNIPNDIIDPDSSNQMCQSMTAGSLGPVPVGGGGPLGNAAITSPTGDGSGGPVTYTRYAYREYYNNASTNPPSEVAGCTWNFGDGTTVNNTACNGGDQIFHEYPRLNPEPPIPQACPPGNSPPRASYTVSLIVRLRNGTSYTDSQTELVPDCM